MSKTAPSRIHRIIMSFQPCSNRLRKALPLRKTLSKIAANLFFCLAVSPCLSLFWLHPCSFMSSPLPNKAVYITRLGGSSGQRRDITVLPRSFKTSLYSAVWFVLIELSLSGGFYKFSLAGILHVSQLNINLIRLLHATLYFRFIILIFVNRWFIVKWNRTKRKSHSRSGIMK